MMATALSLLILAYKYQTQVILSTHDILAITHSHTHLVLIGFLLSDTYSHAGGWLREEPPPLPSRDELTVLLFCRSDLSEALG